MNCKKGDLAIIVGGFCNSGKVVECLRFLGPVDWFGGMPLIRTDLPRWLVRTRCSPLETTDGERFTEVPIPDAWLRPIRPGEEPTVTETREPALAEQ